MSMQVIGSCGRCGGPVTMPMYWGGTVPPVGTCQRCGATAKQSGSPVIDMDPPPEVRIPKLGGPVAPTFEAERAKGGE